MSMQQAPRATFRGFDGPLYSPVLVGLGRVFTKSNPAGMDDERFGQAMRQCPGFEFCRPHAPSGDRYVWRCAVIFRVANGGEVAIALPMARDDTEADGTRLDRSPAMYVRGGADFRAAERVAATLMHTMHAVNASAASE